MGKEAYGWVREEGQGWVRGTWARMLSSRSAKKNALGKYKNYSKLIDETLLTGAQKLWIWEHLAISKVAWDFLIHDFSPSFVKTKLQPIQTKYLKKWSGLARAADPSVRYQSRENAGLGMKESCEEHKRQRLIRRHQLATSEDPKVKAIHEEFADFQRLERNW